MTPKKTAKPPRQPRRLSKKQVKRRTEVYWKKGGQE